MNKIAVNLVPQFLPVAGACFMEPEEGDQRIKRGMVEHFDPSNPNADDGGWVKVSGYLVQEYGPRYDEDGFELCGGGVWRTVGPLDEFPALKREVEAMLKARESA